jgi:protein-disulfide isomerase
MMRIGHELVYEVCIVSTETEPQGERLDDAPRSIAKAPSANDPVVQIPRATFNYIVVAITFLVVGLVIGVLAYDRVSRDNRANSELLINQAVATAIAALPTAAPAAVPAAPPTVDPDFRYDVSDVGRPAIGPEDAPVTIIEFGDFRCGFCKRFNDETLGRLLADYEGQVRFVYRDFPILGPDSLQAALAAQCAHEQDQFWPFHDLLFTNPQSLTRATFLNYAEQLELDMEDFTVCLDEERHADIVLQDYQDGVSVGVGGTPTFFINGKILVGAQPYAQFARLIDAELAALEGS